MDSAVTVEPLGDDCERLFMLAAGERVFEILVVKKEYSLVASGSCPIDPFPSPNIGISLPLWTTPRERELMGSLILIPYAYREMGCELECVAREGV